MRKMDSYLLVSELFQNQLKITTDVKANTTDVETNKTNVEKNKRDVKDIKDFLKCIEAIQTKNLKNKKIPQIV